MFLTCILNLICKRGRDVLPDFPQFMKGGGAGITAWVSSSASLHEFSNINPFFARTLTQQLDVNS